MGYHRSFLFAAPLLLALPVHAQQAEDAAPVFTLPPTSAPQPANPNRQGPELDVFRGPAAGHSADDHADARARPARATSPRSTGRATACPPVARYPGTDGAPCGSGTRNARS